MDDILQRVKAELESKVVRGLQGSQIEIQDCLSPKAMDTAMSPVTKLSSLLFPSVNQFQRANGAAYTDKGKMLSSLALSLPPG